MSEELREQLRSAEWRVERAIQTACGWAFDCGAREEHVWRLRNTLRLMESVYAQHGDAAVAAERERLDEALRERDDARRVAKRLARDLDMPLHYRGIDIATALAYEVEP